MLNDASIQEDFNKARNKARLQTIISKLKNENPELLNLYDVTKILKPKRENYVGIRPIKVDQIIGSEGRSHDFTGAFFPKKDMLRYRWQSIDDAYYNMVNLPPISVFKLGDRYFVRDGNHRVSVAKTQNMAFIDAEIVELDSQIELEPNMTLAQIKKKLLEYEREQAIKEYNLNNILPMDKIRFTGTGSYAELINHIMVHKYYINQNREDEISFKKAAKSWYKNVFDPIRSEIQERGLLLTYPERTVGDMYLWIVRNLYDLQLNNKEEASVKTAVKNFEKHEKKLPLLKRIVALFKE